MLSSVRQTCASTTTRTTQIRSVSRGALSGGFSKGSLQNWAVNHWNESPNETTYVDLYNERVTNECSAWLASHPHPSSELAKAFFGSICFFPERIILTPIFGNSQLPIDLQMGSNFLAWQVVSDTPHEMILSWNFGSLRGCTFVAFDPSLRRVYHGNCLDSKANNSWSVNAMIPFHQAYAKFLLAGMVKKLEGIAAKSQP